MAPQSLPATRKPTFRRAFLPFWIALVLGSLILARDYHVRHVDFTRLSVRVTVDGHQQDEDFFVEVDGKRQGIFAPVPIGFAKIRIYTSDTEPKDLKRFIWYGVTDLGSVDLALSRGSLRVNVLPPPDSYELKGKRGSWTNTMGFFMNLPVGRYDLVNRFESVVKHTEAEVKRNQTNQVNAKFAFGAVEIVTTPPNATVGWAGTEKGKTPLTLRYLVPGTYKMEAVLEGYDSESLQVKVEAGAESKVALTLINTRYRQAVADARQNLEQKQYGRSALYLEMALAAKPGDELATKLLSETKTRGVRDRAEELVRQGDFDAALMVLDSALKDVSGDLETKALREKIRSTKARTTQEQAESRFQQLVAEAKSAGAGKDYAKALALLDRAREIFPGRSEIEGLKTLFRTDQSKQFAAVATQALIARKTNFNNAFERALGYERDDLSFPLNNWKTSKSAAEVLKALEQLAKEKPFSAIHELNQLSPEMFNAKIGALLANGDGFYSRIGVVTYETGNTQVFVKVFAYADGRKAGVESFTFKNAVERFRKDLSSRLSNDLR